MSLVQHLSATDGVDRVPDPTYPEQTKTVRRVLSYDAFPQEPEPVEHKIEPELAPYKVSTAKRIIQVAVTILSCWLSSGIVFGFASLKPVLISEGVYAEKCGFEAVDDGDGACFQQDIRLNLFFTIGSITANVSALPVGTLLDRYGPRACTIAGSFLLAFGSLLMALSCTIPQLNAYILGNIFLALGGTCVFVPAYQVADAFPRYSGTIVALVTGAFDASAAVFLFYQLIYRATSGGFRPHQFFFVYLALPVFILITQLTIMPAHGYKTIPQLEKKLERAQDATLDVHDSDDEIDSDTELWRVRSNRATHRQDKIQQLDDLLGDDDERQQKADQEEQRQVISGVWGVLHGQPAHKQMLSPWFILITLLTILQMLRMNYFIATIKSQYAHMLHSDTLSTRVNDFFNIALPIGGIISTPFIGLLLDNLRVWTMLGVIVVLATAIGVLNSVPMLWVGYATVVLFVLLRPLYYSAMSDYATKVFGFATFGRVYGTIICVSGLVNFAQIGLDKLTFGHFMGDPIPVNSALAVVGFVVGTALVIFVRIEGKRRIREQLKEDMAYERESLMESVLEERDEDM